MDEGNTIISISTDLSVIGDVTVMSLMLYIGVIGISEYECGVVTVIVALVVSTTTMSVG